MIGERFTRLTVLYKTDEKLGTSYKYMCRCDCGVEKLISSAHLKRGNTRSCGCLKKEVDRERGRAYNLKYCHKHTYNTDFFINYSDNLAYFIGLMLTDGYVTPNVNAAAIYLSEVDKQLLEVISKTIFLNDYSLRKKLSKVSIIKGKEYISRDQYGIVICNRLIVEKMKEYGIVPNKTFITCAPEVFMNNRHFWRGVMDGDGSFSISNGERLVFQGALYGTKELCNEFTNFLRLNNIENKFTIYDKEKISFVRFSHLTAKKTHHLLYDNLSEQDWKLERKYNKLKDYDLLYDIKRSSAI